MAGWKNGLQKSELVLSAPAVDESHIGIPFLLLDAWWNMKAGSC